jgi:hypothetical protein
MSTWQDLPASARRLARESKPHFRFNREVRAEATDCWYVPYEDSNAFLRAVAGDVQGDKNQFTRIVPLRHVDLPWCVAYDLDGELVGWDETLTGPMGEVGYFAGLKCKIAYKVPAWDLDGADAFLEIAGRPSPRTLFAPGSAATFPDSSHPVHDPGIFVPGFQYDVTVHQLPFLDEATYQAYMGGVNNATFRRCPAGTVLYEGPSFVRTSTFGGVTTYKVTHSFQVSAVPWQYEAKASGALDAIQLNGSYRYFPTDFSVLFPAG